MITRFPAIALLVTMIAHSVDRGPAELRFDWPGELVAGVETERTRERNTGKLQSRTARLTYRMQVSSHTEGLLVAHDQFSVQGPSAAQQRESAELLETRMRHPVEGVKTGTQTDRRVSRFAYPAQ